MLLVALTTILNWYSLLLMLLEGIMQHLPLFWTGIPDWLLMLLVALTFILDWYPWLTVDIVGGSSHGQSVTQSITHLYFGLVSLTDCWCCWWVQPWTARRTERLAALDNLMPTLQAYTYYEAYLWGNKLEIDKKWLEINQKQMRNRL